MVESRLTNDISPESTPGAGRRRARTPHSFPHVKYTTQMSVPDQTELDKLRQRINFTDLDEVKHCCTCSNFLFFWSTQYFLNLSPRIPQIDEVALTDLLVVMCHSDLFHLFSSFLI